MPTHGAQQRALPTTCNSAPGIHEPDRFRQGNAPAEVVRAGSRHAPMWAALCLDCGGTTRWQPLLSGALADLTWHQEMHRVWRAELSAEQRRVKQLTLLPVAS